MTEKKTILFADDDERIRLLCQEVLSNEGYHVMLAKNGKEALKTVEKTNPDLVILDMVMPEMDGMEALPRILREKRNIPVILYSAYTRYREDFMSWAADAYVVKSSDLTELKEKIRELLSTRYPSGEAQ